MWRRFEETSRTALVVMAFAMAFLLTPRSWIRGAHAPSDQTEAVPVDTLDSSDSCLWCDDPGGEEAACDDDSADRPNSSGFHGRECSQDDSAGTGPNA